MTYASTTGGRSVRSKSSTPSARAAQSAWREYNHGLSDEPQRLRNRNAFVVVPGLRRLRRPRVAEVGVRGTHAESERRRVRLRHRLLGKNLGLPALVRLPRRARARAAGRDGGQGG